MPGRCGRGGNITRGVCRSGRPEGGFDLVRVQRPTRRSYHENFGTNWVCFRGLFVTIPRRTNFRVLKL